MAIDVKQLIDMLLRNSSAVQSPFAANGFTPNQPLMQQAVASQMTPSQASSSFSPEVLLSSGLFDPTMLAQLQNTYLQQQVNDWESKFAEKYAGLPNVNEDEFFSYNYDQWLNNPQQYEVKDLLVNSMFPAIARGEQTVEQAKTKMLDMVENGEIPGVDISMIPTLNTYVDQFGKELPDYFRKKADYETSRSTLDEQMRLGAPTEDVAKLKMWDELGMPQMALLPSPTERYTFSVNDMRPGDILNEYRQQGLIKPQAGQTVTTRIITTPDLTAPPPPDAELRRQAAPIAQAAREKYLQENLRGENFGTKAADTLQNVLVPPVLDGVGNWMFGKKTGDINKDVRKKADEVYNQVLMQEMSKRRVGGVNRRTQISRSGPVQPAGTFANDRTAYIAARQDAQNRASQLENALVGAGITPFQQAMINFGLYQGKQK